VLRANGPDTEALEQIRAASHGRKPIFETRSTSAGRVVVEAFPIHLAAYEPAAAAARPGFAVVEIAAYMNGGGNLWPLQRNLLFNPSAALALLGSMVMMRIRFKAYLAGQYLRRLLRRLLRPRHRHRLRPRRRGWQGRPRRHVEATRQLNQLLCERASCERYASMFWGYFAPEAGAFRYINAGHLPPLLFTHRLTSGGPVRRAGGG
jgi:hypothetical protein